MMPLSADGDLCIITSAETDVLLDVMAFMPVGSDVTTITPARLFDSRAGGETIDGSDSGRRVGSGRGTPIRFRGRGGVPNNRLTQRQVTALELNRRFGSECGVG
jgi:hypothetical protein